MYRILAILFVLFVSVIDVSAQLIDVVDVVNRGTRTLPILIDSVAIVQRGSTIPFDARKLRLKRCDNGADVPFCLDPWSPGADSVLCWFRLDNIAASASVQIRVELDQSLTTSRSNGKAVFINYVDSLSAGAATGPAGPWSIRSDSTPAFGRGFHINARLAATAPTGGYFCYFGANTQGTSGYVIKHEARQGNRDADHLLLTNGTATPVTDSTRVWDVGEAVRYSFVLTPTSNAIERTSERVGSRPQLLRTDRPAGLTWTMYGAASLPQAAQNLRVSYVRMRPIYDIRPRSTRRNAQIIADPPNGVICQGSPVTLQIPGGGWQSIKWSTGQTGPSITVTTPGTYTAELSDGRTCTVRTEAITVSAAPSPNAGNDTTRTLCLGGIDTLKVASGFASYEWYMSSGLKLTKLPFDGPVAVIDSADVYRCFVRSAAGCSDTVRFVINRTYDTTARIVFPFANPTVCDGDSIVIAASPPQSAEYRWSRNGVLLTDETGDRLVVRDSGTYSVAIRIGNTVGGCLSFASVRVGKAIRDTLRIQPRYILCEGDTVVMDAGGFSQVGWWRVRNGRPTQLLATSRTYSATSSDTIDCIASTNGACADTARTIIEWRSSPPISIRVAENKSTMCRGETLTLVSTATTGNLRWRLGTTPLDKVDSASIQITEPGTYYLTVDYGNTCRRVDSITINDGLAPPDIVAIDGVAICPGGTTRLTTAGKFTTYLWSTGETEDTITVSNPGVYSVTVTLFGCQSTTSIRIEVANPNGPTLKYSDSTMICDDSPFAWLAMGNIQGVPRTYYITVLDSTRFAATARQIVIDGVKQGTVGFRYVGSGIPNRFDAFSVYLRDDCNWEKTIVLTVENLTKIVPLDVQLNTSLSDVRSGDDMVLRFVGPERSDLSNFTTRDTVWIDVSVPPDLLEITAAKAACGDQLTVLNDSAGTVRYTLTGCATASASTLIEQSLSVLVGETLEAFVSIDSVSTTSPCIAAPLSRRRFDLNITPFGCEIRTIARSQNLIMGISSVGQSSVTAVITRSTGVVTVRAVDVLGRVHDTAIVPAGEGARLCHLSVDSSTPMFITAYDELSTMTIPMFGATR